MSTVVFEGLQLRVVGRAPKPRHAGTDIGRRRLSTPSFWWVYEGEAWMLFADYGLGDSLLYLADAEVRALTAKAQATTCAHRSYRNLFVLDLFELPRLHYQEEWDALLSDGVAEAFRRNNVSRVDAEVLFAEYGRWDFAVLKSACERARR